MKGRVEQPCCLHALGIFRDCETMQAVPGITHTDGVNASELAATATLAHSFNHPNFTCRLCQG